MLKVFKVLESSGLGGFLGCSVSIYEEDIQEFFANAKLPTDGLVVETEFPERMVTQMKLEFLESGVPMKSSCKKKAMKVEYRLLNGILTKALISIAGSFDVVTQERFDMMVAIMGGDGGKAATAKAKGLGAMHSKAEAVVDPGVKKKRTTMGRAAPSFKEFNIVPFAVDAIPIQMVRLVSSLDKNSAAPKCKLIVEEDSDSEDAEPLNKMIKASNKPTPMSSIAPKTLAV
ncbi:phospholipid-transporting ATPase 4-like [Dorcoceras hygrometricum]|uniref:Phospholipid-transporting ATPase 4-like n=1 Tax=Dorcoceras hygrometricum TaxID=472368 RepID=A0A2Z7AZP1_9LAMI|nr:phospholipid-transporting ATPase 4-like [Dorcoceras hygrometricum]